MLLLHGLPGNERKGDLAQAVRRAGYAVRASTMAFQIRHVEMTTVASRATGFNSELSGRLSFRDPETLEALLADVRHSGL